MTCEITQTFYGNATDLYKKSGMLGHGAEDEVCGYGSPIECPLDGYVYSVFDDVHRAGDGYWGVYMICEYKGQVGELCVGHPSKILVPIGQNVKKGEIIGLEGNHGTVFVGQEQITIPMQIAGDHRGSHRHWQWRPLKKVPDQSTASQYIKDFTNQPYKDKDGNYFIIPEYSNGFKGLSPLIANILKDYDDWKFSQAVIGNIETVPNQTLLSTIQKMIDKIRSSILALIKNKNNV